MALVCRVVGNREQAFVYALTGASLTHAVAKACSAGTSIRCGCGATPRDPPDGDFRWGGCNDDAVFAAQFSRTFTEAGYSGRKKLSKRTMTNKHNYAAGRKVSRYDDHHIIVSGVNFTRDALYASMVYVII